MSIRGSPSQGIVARILTGRDGKKEFYPQVLICLVGEDGSPECRVLGRLPVPQKDRAARQKNLPLIHVKNVQTQALSMSPRGILSVSTFISIQFFVTSLQDLREGPFRDLFGDFHFLSDTMRESLSPRSRARRGNNAFAKRAHERKLRDPGFS
jgi:hypothetical protein